MSCGFSSGSVPTESDEQDCCAKQTDKNRNSATFFIVTEALKRRYNQGKESNLYFYRDSNQNEVDLLLKKHSGLYGIEIKSAMTYHADFEKALKQMDGWVKETILGKAVAYAGTLENTAGEIKLLNYSHLDEVLA